MLTQRRLARSTLTLNPRHLPRPVLATLLPSRAYASRNGGGNVGGYGGGSGPPSGPGGFGGVGGFGGMRFPGGGMMPPQPPPPEKGEYLRQFSIDLTELAEKGKLDPVIGRDEEIRRTIQILSRRTKSNPVLLGLPGVGKTAILEGLATRIVNKEVPEVSSSRHGPCSRQSVITRQEVAFSRLVDAFGWDRNPRRV